MLEAEEASDSEVDTVRTKARRGTRHKSGTTPTTDTSVIETSGRRPLITATGVELEVVVELEGSHLVEVDEEGFNHCGALPAPSPW